MLYADFEYYSRTYKGKLPQEEAEKALKQASRHIDSLTFNRIVGKGFENLTEFQQNIIKECACMMADFENANGDMINSVVNSYSINGASIAFGREGVNYALIGDVVVQRDTYSYLAQTGLTSRNLGV